MFRIYLVAWLLRERLDNMCNYTHDKTFFFNLGITDHMHT